MNESTNEVLHYAEKPETFVSDIINCGVYLFSSSIFTLIDNCNNSTYIQILILLYST